MSPQEQAQRIVNCLVDAIESHPDMGPEWDLMREEEKASFQEEIRDAVLEVLS